MNKWISIDIKLPKVCDDVLLFSDDKFQFDVGFYSHNKFHCDRGELPTVTHWMPLPDPPAEFELEIQ